MLDSLCLPRRQRASLWMLPLMLILAVDTGAFPDQLFAQGPFDSAPDGRTTLTFDIPPQALSSALVTFSETTRLELLVDSGLTQGVQTPGVSGPRTSEEALRAMLAGTGLTYRFIEPQIVTLERDGSGSMVPAAAESTVAAAEKVAPKEKAPTGQKAQKPVKVPEIVVKDVRERETAEIGSLPPEYAGGQVASGGRVGVFGNRNIFEVPYNLLPLTRDVIDNQQARTMADVVRNDASVTVMQGGNLGGSDESFNIRGFRSFGSTAMYDGLVGLIGRSQALEAVERVEIIKGPSTFLNGGPNATVGGTVNYVPKRASDVPLRRLITRYFSDSVVGAHADIGQRFGEDNRFGIRVNGALRGGETALDLTDKRNDVGSLALDYRGDRFRLVADLEYSYAHTGGRLGGTLLNGGIRVPDAPRNRNNWSQPWSEAAQRKVRGVIRAEWDFASNWTLSVAHGQLDQHDATYVLCDPTVLDAGGNLSFSCSTGGTLNKVRSSEVRVKGLFATGPVTHRMSLGASWVHEDMWNSFTDFTVPGNTGSNLYRPRYYPRPGIPALKFSGKTGAVTYRTLYVADELGLFNDRLLLTFGGRGVNIDTANFNATTGAQTSSFDKSAFTPSAGVVFKLLPVLSLYGNYAEGLEQSGTAPLFANNVGEVLPPLRSTQVETGVKLDLGRFAATFSAFRIAKANTILLNNVFGVDGEQVNHGLEFSAFGEVTTGLRMLGSAALIQAKQTRTAGGQFDGKTAFSVPKTQISTGIEWDLPWLKGGTLTGNVLHASSAYVDAANTQQIPGWVRFDIGARYAFLLGRYPSMLRLYLENVANENYWSGVDRGSLYLSQPRTVSLSLMIDF